MREDWVQRAVEFLQNDVVKDPVQAAQFLRAKGYTEEELAEAWRRAGNKFGEESKPPSPLDLSLGNGHVPPAAVGVGVQSKRAVPGAWTWAWRLALTVGAISVLREFLRKYVVPAYFPQQNKAAKKPASEASVLRRELRQLRQSIEDLSATIRTMSDQAQQQWRDTQEQLRDLRTEVRQLRSAKPAVFSSAATESTSAGNGPATHGTQPVLGEAQTAAPNPWTLPDFDSIEPADLPT